MITQFSREKPKKPITKKNYDFIGSWYTGTSYDIWRGEERRMKKKWRILISKDGETFKQEVKL